MVGSTQRRDSIAEAAQMGLSESELRNSTMALCGWFELADSKEQLRDEVAKVLAEVWIAGRRMTQGRPTGAQGSRATLTLSRQWLHQQGVLVRENVEHDVDMGRYGSGRLLAPVRRGARTTMELRIEVTTPDLGKLCERLRDATVNACEIWIDGTRFYPVGLEHGASLTHNQVDTVTAKLESVS